jgi:hypothetical protein
MAAGTRLVNWPAPVLAMLAAWLAFVPLDAEEDYERDPINYWRVTPSDPVSRLKQRLETGELKLDRSDEKRFLKAVLKELAVPESSQVLVFSKTSLQRSLISPESPRAIYFSDDIYVGWVPGGSIELSCSDSALGPTFYLLQARRNESPPLITRPQDCMSCHGTSMTGGFPGYMVRSVYPAASGDPILSAGTKLTDHSSPIHERWGGWYVTGLHDPMRHRGNVMATLFNDGATLDMEKGANLKSLAAHFDISRYLLDQSDIVALLVLEHQIGMHNRLAHGTYAVRTALYYQDALRRETGLTGDSLHSESTRRIIDAEAVSIVSYMLFQDETLMASEGVTSHSTFAEDFQARGGTGSAGGSLRSLHLGRRLFRNRCSYMIHSAAFDALPAPLTAAIAAMLGDALAGDDSRQLAAHLSAEEKSRICRILRETKPELTKDWVSSGSSAGPERASTLR